MRLLPRAVQDHRLLSNVQADEASACPAPTDKDESPFALKGAGLFCGNARWIFLGVFVGAFLLSVGGYGYVHRHQQTGQTARFIQFIRARTHSVSGSPTALVPPEPVIVEINTDLIHISAIALGHPRLAVINGQSAAEGEWVKVRSNNPPAIVPFRVLKIGDGRVDLANGKQTVTARFTPNPEGTAQAH